MHLYYTYILHCSDGSYYIGVTNDLQTRIIQHQLGGAATSYTYNRRPIKLAYYEEYQWIQDAIAREKQLKGWSRKKKEAIIAGNNDLLPVLAKKVWRRE